MPSISHSRADSYLLCRRRDYYGYTLSLQKRVENENLALGSAVHECLETLYRHVLAAGTTRRKQKAALKGGFKAMHEKYLEIVKGGFTDRDDRMALKDILRWYVELEPFVSDGWLIMAVEQEYLLEYDEETESRFRFVIDLVAEDPDGKIAIIDHKTAYDFFSADMANLQGQIPKYIGAMRALGHKAHYGVYNQLRTRKIRGDKKLKGQLIADLEAAGYEHHEMRVEETPEVDEDSDYFTTEALVHVPLSKLSVADLTTAAKNLNIDLYAGPSPEQVHEFMPIKPTATRVVRTFEEQIAVAAEITAREQLPVEVIEQTAFRTANKMVCGFCDFRDLCEAQLAGQSVKLMLQNEFVEKVRRPKIEVTNQTTNHEIRREER